MRVGTPISSQDAQAETKSFWAHLQLELRAQLAQQIPHRSLWAGENPARLQVRMRRRRNLSRQISWAQLAPLFGTGVFAPSASIRFLKIVPRRWLQASLVWLEWYCTVLRIHGDGVWEPIRKPCCEWTKLCLSFAVGVPSSEFGGGSFE